MNLPKSFQLEYTSFHSKVAQRIFLLFILCAVIPLSILAYFSYSQVTKNLYSQADEDLHRTSKTFGMMTFDHLQFLESDLDMLSTILENRGGA